MTRKDWIMNQVDKAATRRDWSALPWGFQNDAVRALVVQLKPHMDKRDIALRIQCSQVHTFAALKATLEQMRF